jgi:hypothetical protein
MSTCKVRFEEKGGSKKKKVISMTFIQIICVVSSYAWINIVFFFFFRLGSVRVIKKSHVSILRTRSVHPLPPTSCPDRWVSSKLNINYYRFMSVQMYPSLLGKNAFFVVPLAMTNHLDQEITIMYGTKKQSQTLSFTRSHKFILSFLVSFLVLSVIYIPIFSPHFWFSFFLFHFV